MNLFSVVTSYKDSILSKYKPQNIMNPLAVQNPHQKYDWTNSRL